jgi:hypothetical protein
MVFNISNLTLIKNINGIIHIGSLKNEDKHDYLLNFNNITENDIICIDGNISSYGNKITDIKLQKKYYDNKFNFLVLSIEDFNILFLKDFIELENFVDYIYIKMSIEQNNQHNVLDNIDDKLNTLQFKKYINNDGNLFYCKYIYDISPNYTIEYGLEQNRINIKNNILEKTNSSGIYLIPLHDDHRASLFGDPLFGKVKNIYISDRNTIYTINPNNYVNIDIVNHKIYINENVTSNKVKNKINYLSIMAIFKNETMNLKVWLEHYLWQGVDHFYLIDNGSTDNPFDILKEYIQKGIVTYYYRTEKYQQPQHYRYVFDKENIKHKTKWLCICDLDEFFFGIKKKLSHCLDYFDSYDVIYTNSFFYGSDGLIEHPKDIRTSIIHRESDVENGIKYIFKPSSITNSNELWIHYLVNEGTLSKKYTNEITQNNVIRLNHYRIQSYEYYTKIKMTRGDVSIIENENIRDLKYFEKYAETANIKDDILKKLVENNYSTINTPLNTALIVEPRFLKHLPFVINDFNNKLGNEWKIVFYCGAGLKNIWIDLINKDIELRELEYNGCSYDDYCDFIKSKKLYETLYGDYVLIFTPNSTIINKHPYTIDYFMSLNKSYIGGNQSYLWNEMIRENLHPKICNFQGGLSLRKRLDMIKIIDTFGTEKNILCCGGSKKLQTDAEDVYFTTGCYKLNLPVGDDEICRHFSLHTILVDGFFGANRLETGYYLNIIRQYDDACDNIYLCKNIEDTENETLVVHPGVGFFSNCTVKLFDIILYFNSTKKTPIFIDSSKQFDLYKNNNIKNDITYEYFIKGLEHHDIIYNNSIDFKEEYQYINYNKLNFTEITPFITKYFSPTISILDTINFIESKYNIKLYDNICVLFYRGNDKIIETKLPSYQEFIVKARNLYNKNNDIIFLIQSDEIEFIENMIQEFPNNSFYFKDEIRTIHKSSHLSVDRINTETNFMYSQYYLAITIIMSKCKYVICTTGNCSLWIALFRGNVENFYQIEYNKICIHKYLSKCKTNAQPPGLGDFIRGSIALFNYSKKYNFDFYFDDSHPLFNNLSKNNKIIKNDIFDETTEILPPKTYNDIDKELNMLFLKDKSFCIMTNAFYTKNSDENMENFGEITHECKLFFKDILTPNKITSDYLKNVFTNLKIDLNKSYSIIHLRLGDNFLWNDTYDNNLFDKFNKKIKELLTNNQDHQFILLSDSSSISIQLKKENPELFYWDNKKIHIGDLKSNSVSDCVTDTMIDFFIMINCDKMYCHAFNGISGFSKLISLLYDKEYIMI